MDSVRREHCAETLGNDRGKLRVKLRRDSIMEVDIGIRVGNGKRDED